MKKKEKHPVTIRVLLYLIFSISVLIPVICFLIVIPSFFRKEMNTQLIEDVDSKLVSVSSELLNTVFSLQQISILSYSDNKLYSFLMDEGKNEIVELSNEIPIFNYMKLLHNDVTSIIILGANDNIYYYHRNQNNYIKENYDFSEYKNFEVGQDFYIGAHYSQYFEKNNPKVFSYVKVVNHPYDNEKLCTIIIDSDSSIFNRVFASMNMNKSTISVLLDEKDNIIYSSQDIPKSIIDSLKKQETEVKYKNEINKVKYRKIPLGNWTIAVLVSTEAIEERIQLIYLVCFLASIITILFSFIFLRVISIKYMLRPLSEMSHVMAEAEKGNLSVHFESKSSDEISLLGRKLNRMIDELQNLIDKEYKLVISQKQAEYRALQARIKPHFLYNSLNCIVGLNRIGERNKLEEAILDLTDMMRYTLSPSNKNGWSTIAQEINFVKQYIHLEKLRFEDKLNFKLIYEIETKDYNIPKLLIQPLIENSVIHNVEKSLDSVKIIITIKLIEDNNLLQIIVEDEGTGFDTETNGEGIGLYNVRERLKYAFKKSDMKVQSEIGKGTKIEILISSDEVKNANINS